MISTMTKARCPVKKPRVIVAVTVSHQPRSKPMTDIEARAKEYLSELNYSEEKEVISGLLAELQAAQQEIGMLKQDYKELRNVEVAALLNLRERAAQEADDNC